MHHWGQAWRCYRPILLPALSLLPVHRLSVVGQFTAPATAVFPSTCARSVPLELEVRTTLSPIRCVRQDVFLSHKQKKLIHVSNM